jgi:hypothetical protein
MAAAMAAASTLGCASLPASLRLLRGLRLPHRLLVALAAEAYRGAAHDLHAQAPATGRAFAPCPLGKCSQVKCELQNLFKIK